MKNILCFLMINFLFISLGNSSNIESISYPYAVSQTGRFKINNTSPLVVDIKESLNLTKFLAFTELSTQQLILTGGIANDEKLKIICEHPTFLKNEKIADLPTVAESDIQYFNTKLYSGCQIRIDEKRSALIIARTDSFVSQDGELIKYVGVVSTTRKINDLKESDFISNHSKRFFHQHATD